MFRSRLLIAIAAPLVFVAGAAMADPIVINDVVAVAAVKTATNYDVYNYSNEPSFEGYRDTVTLANAPNAPAGAIGKNYYWGDIVGDRNTFDVESLTINRGVNDITFTLKTNFGGTWGGDQIRSDWFLDTLTPLIPDSFNYAIVLGPDLTRGTLAAGFYEVQTVKTPLQIWGSGYGVGGLVQFCTDNPTDPGPCDQTASSGFALAPPTLLATGNKIGNVSVTVGAANQTGQWGNNYRSVTVVVSGVNMSIFDQFDILAHSADCSNDALWGTVSTTVNVPAPGALALIGLGLLGMGLLRRRSAVAA